MREKERIKTGLINAHINKHTHRHTWTHTEDDASS